MCIRDRPNTASGSNVSVTVNASPARIIDGILTKIFPLEVPKPEPLDVTVSQVAGTNTERALGHSVKFLTENYPIPIQYYIHISYVQQTLMMYLFFVR